MSAPRYRQAKVAFARMSGSLRNWHEMPARASCRNWSTCACCLILVTQAGIGAHGEPLKVCSGTLRVAPLQRALGDSDLVGACGVDLPLF